MLGIIGAILGVLTLCACVFALIRGGTPERLASVLILASVPVGILIRKAPVGLVPTLDLTGDAVIAFIMLGLTLRYTSRWLGLVMLLYAAQFALHAAYFVLALAPDLLHDLIETFIFIAVTISLTAGTIASRRARVSPAAPAEGGSVATVH